MVPVKRLVPLFAALVLSACASYHGDPILGERERRAEAELQDLNALVRSGTMSSVEFEFNKAKLLPQSHPFLDKLAEILLRQKQVKLVIVGHTDDIGDKEYNLWLSQERAKAVKDYIVSKGVPPEYMKTYGFGESVPIVTNNSEPGRALNRRVDFRFTSRKWDSVF